ncbi:hypothetical protein BHM03_00042609 [Ensete ventricosum]|nr:hypothetical protein BHM03_00042609 [Ensete ventricosum]
MLSCHAARFETPPSCFTGVIRLRFNAYLPVRPTGGTTFKPRTYCTYETGSCPEGKERPLLLPNVTAAVDMDRVPRHETLKSTLPMQPLRILSCALTGEKLTTVGLSGLLPSCCID